MITPSDILAARILVVDDKPSNVLLLDRMLKGAGYGKNGTVTSTMIPDEVCELHLKNRYDLILLDLQMPGMDGFQVMENLKEIEPGDFLPVIVVTAQPELKMRALKAGARDFVGKPFDMAEVLVRVHNMLEVRLLHTETRRLYDRVVAEQKVSERLLLSVLPHAVAHRLKARPEGLADGFPSLVGASDAEVTVLFSDIAEFTRFAEGASAEVLMGVLKDISDRFEGDPDERRFEEIRTIGDAYLAAMGMPDAVADHTILAAHMALDMTRALDRFNEHSRYKLKLRIGVEPDPARPGTERRVVFDV